MGEQDKDEPMEEAKEEATNELEDRASQGQEAKIGVVARGIRGGQAPPPQVPSVDALLCDIYELRDQVSQLSTCMYHYWAKRDMYHQERDEFLISFIS